MLSLLADMGVSPTTIKTLRDAGYNVVHVSEIGLAMASDAVILSRAHSEGRIVITFDLDFGNIMAASGKTVPSVITIRTANQTPTVVNPLLLRIIAKQRESLEAGCLLVIEEGRQRLRRLPISR